MDSPQPRTDPLLGRVLDGRYRIHSLIGEGGMGTVYRATHLLMGKSCAIKVLRGAGAEQELAGKRFQREAQSASRLDHEHCIRVTDFGVTADYVMYLVMELLDGHTLAEELGQVGALPIARVVGIARQMAEALAHAHELGIVHRDLKPDNIFLVTRSATTDFVKVLDFGLAKLNPEARREGLSLSTLSEVGTIFGTPEYMSPEQAEARPLDARSDLYSFGCVLYQMMTGQLPFQAASYVVLLTKKLSETPISPSVRRPELGLPASLVTLCMQCLERDPEARPASARAIAEELAVVDVPKRVPALVAAHPTVELPMSAGPEDKPLPWRLLAGACVVAAIAVAGVMLYEAREAAPARSKEAAEVVKPAPPPATPAAIAPAPTLVAAPDPPAAIPDAGVGARAEIESKRPDHLREAARFRREGNRIKEVYHLQQALRFEPGNREANYRLGAILIEDGQVGLGCSRLLRAGPKSDNAVRSLWDHAGCADPAPH